MENNIFKFASKELSQDAFLCWLINGINTEDEKSQKISKKFIKMIIDKIGDIKLQNCIKNEEYKIEIKKQYKSIDILLIIGNYYIIIEDKIKTYEHDNQIYKYEYSLIKNGIPYNNIFTCYYKIYDEYNIHNKFVNAIITRKDMISLLKDECKDNIYIKDYYEYLSEIEKYSLDRFISEKIKYEKSDILRKPQDAIYTNFYGNLEKKEKTEEIIGWGYADNKSGGTWWYSSKKFNNVISNDFSYIYAEINLKANRNKIVLKLAKKEKLIDIPAEEKIEKYLNDKEYLENGNLKYYDKKEYYILDYEKNEPKKMLEYKCYKNLNKYIDIYNQVITDELLKNLKKFDIGLNNSKGIIKKDNGQTYKYYARIASINVNKYTLEEIEKILDIINKYLKNIRIIC